MSTLDRRSRAEIGRSANRKGKDAEQAVARFLREHGWPDAQRTVRTGWKSGDTRSRDRGDVDGTPGICWQVKTSVEDFTDTRVLRVLAATADQAVASGADLGIVVQRRNGAADPGRWWTWTTAGDLLALADAARNPDVLTVPEPHLSFPVRLMLADLVPLLHAAGHTSAHHTEEGFHQ